MAEQPSLFRGMVRMLDSNGQPLLMTQAGEQLALNASMGMYYVLSAHVQEASTGCVYSRQANDADEPGCLVRQFERNHEGRSARRQPRQCRAVRAALPAPTQKPNSASLERGFQ